MTLEPKFPGNVLKDSPKKKKKQIMKEVTGTRETATGYHLLNLIPNFKFLDT